MDDQEEPTDFGILCSAVIMGAVADLTGIRLGVVRSRGIEWALANRRPPRTQSERLAEANARAWLLGAPGIIPAAEAAQAVGVRLGRVVEVLLGEQERRRAA